MWGIFVIGEDLGEIWGFGIGGLRDLGVFGDWGFGIWGYLGGVRGPFGEDLGGELGRGWGHRAPPRACQGRAVASWQAPSPRIPVNPFGGDLGGIGASVGPGEIWSGQNLPRTDQGTKSPEESPGSTREQRTADGISYDFL